MAAVQPQSSDNVQPLKGGRAFPDAMDGTTGKTTQEANNRATGEPVNKHQPVPRPDPAVNKPITDAIEQLDSLDAQRQELNAKAKEIIKRLEGKGINRHAFRYARKVMSMSEQKREGFDLSYMLTRQAAGHAMQADWVDISEDETEQ